MTDGTCGGLIFKGLVHPHRVSDANGKGHLGSRTTVPDLALQRHAVSLVSPAIQIGLRYGPPDP